jgi:hypothetical protein
VEELLMSCPDYKGNRIRPGDKVAFMTLFGPRTARVLCIYRDKQPRLPWYEAAVLHVTPVQVGPPSRYEPIREIKTVGPYSPRLFGGKTDPMEGYLQQLHPGTSERRKVMIGELKRLMNESPFKPNVLLGLSAQTKEVAT